jgi:hypothetical protein
VAFSEKPWKFHASAPPSAAPPICILCNIPCYKPAGVSEPFKQINKGGITGTLIYSQLVRSTDKNNLELAISI